MVTVWKRKLLFNEIGDATFGGSKRDLLEHKRSKYRKIILDPVKSAKNFHTETWYLFEYPTYDEYACEGSETADIKCQKI